ncbi:hypothetical protein Bca52824_003128 [Brassica carinata]|uniref:Uncharacterized protein n=1 Tax=Brassica carinata TaxID=52824 RepID=A0A8X7WPP5_BRACI|nr:hypothetical protein Bca52824_003128 [Brassica carinata]
MNHRSLTYRKKQRIRIRITMMEEFGFCKIDMADEEGAPRRWLVAEVCRYAPLDARNPAVETLMMRNKASRARPNPALHFLVEVLGSSLKLSCFDQSSSLIGDLICQLTINRTSSLDKKRLVDPALHFWYLVLLSNYPVLTKALHSLLTINRTSSLDKKRLVGPALHFCSRDSSIGDRNTATSQAPNSAIDPFWKFKSKKKAERMLQREEASSVENVLEILDALPGVKEWSAFYEAAMDHLIDNEGSRKGFITRKTDEDKIKFLELRTKTKRDD